MEPKPAQPSDNAGAAGAAVDSTRGAAGRAARTPYRAPLLRALGVLGVAVAGLGLFLQLGLGIYALRCHEADKNAEAFVRATAVVDPGTIDTTYGLRTGQDGLSPSDRYTVVRALSAAARLEPAQCHQLDALLAEVGARLFFPQVDRMALAAGDVRAALRAADVFEWHRRSDPDDKPTRCTQYVIPPGTVRVYRDRAEFLPAYDVFNPVVVSNRDWEQPEAELAEEKSAGAAAPAATPSTSSAGDDHWPESDYRPLTPAEAAAVVRNVEAASRTKLDPLQTLNVHRMLRSPRQRLVPKSRIASPPDWVHWSGGGLAVEFPNGTAVIYPDGSVTASANHLPRATRPRVRVSAGACLFLGLTSVTGAVLGLFLLLPAGRLLAGSSRARRPALLYASLAIPVALAGAAALGSVKSQSNGTSLPLGSPPAAAAAARRGAKFMAASYGALACAYPLALLLAFRRPIGRESGAAAPAAAGEREDERRDEFAPGPEATETGPLATPPTGHGSEPPREPWAGWRAAVAVAVVGGLAHLALSVLLMTAVPHDADELQTPRMLSRLHVILSLPAVPLLSPGWHEDTPLTLLANAALWGLGAAGIWHLIQAGRLFRWVLDCAALASAWLCGVFVYEIVGAVVSAPPAYGNGPGFSWLWRAAGFTLAMSLPLLLWLALRLRRALVVLRRRRLGRCRTCGYDLRGKPGPCPECGPAAGPNRRFRLAQLWPAMRRAYLTAGGTVLLLLGWQALWRW